jgi:hypothetical protein
MHISMGRIMARTGMTTPTITAIMARRTIMRIITMPMNSRRSGRRDPPSRY